MPQGLELVSGHVTAPSTTFTAWTVHSGNSLTVRNGDLSKKTYLLDLWADNQTAGSIRVRSPRLHDDVQGLRFTALSSDVKPLMPRGYLQRLIPQDTLTVEQTGSGTSGDIESGALLLYYEDVPGVAARLMTADDVMKKVVNIFTGENTLSLGTSGGYSGEEAINADFDNFKANTDYALLGYMVSAECAAIRWRGGDTSNLGVGGPGDDTGAHYTRDWFTRLSRLSGLPTVPIFNSANKAGILIDGVQDENGTDVTVTSIFAQLSS